MQLVFLVWPFCVNCNTYISQELHADSFECITPIEVPLQGCHNQWWGDVASPSTTQVVDHVDKVTQTKEVFEPKDVKYHYSIQYHRSAVNATVCHTPFMVVHPVAVRDTQFLHSLGISIFSRSGPQTLSCQGRHVILKTDQVTYTHATYKWQC